VAKTSRKEGPGEDEAEEVEVLDLAKFRSLRRTSSMEAAPWGEEAEVEAETWERKRSRMSKKRLRGGGSAEAGSDGGGGGKGVEEEEEEKWRGRKGSRRMPARRSAMAGAAEGNGRRAVAGGFGGFYGRPAGLSSHVPGSCLIERVMGRVQVL
jgi:hypothetical protein